MTMPDEKMDAETTAQDHLRSMLDLMKRGARINLTGIPDDPTFLSSNISGAVAKEIATLIESIRTPSDTNAGVGVKVKALVWPKPNRTGDCYAFSVVGQYGVGKIGAGYSAIFRTLGDDEEVDIVLGDNITNPAARALCQADYNRRILSAIEAHPITDVVRTDAERLREALTPSADTKADYLGEFQFTVTMMELDGSDEPYECQRMVTVPWTTIKEIMSAILARAALSGEYR